MDIKLNKETGIASRGGKIPQGATVISPHLKKTSVTLDRDGNEINPATKQIIKRKEIQSDKT